MCSLPRPMWNHFCNMFPNITSECRQQGPTCTYTRLRLDVKQRTFAHSRHFLSKCKCRNGHTMGFCTYVPFVHEATKCFKTYLKNKNMLRLQHKTFIFLPYSWFKSALPHRVRFLCVVLFLHILGVNIAFCFVLMHLNEMEGHFRLFWQDAAFPFEIKVCVFSL